jgi:2-polyprenyl-6-methoxyphenol hydroxylase-like FAD-dependent oxidoreductase
MDSASDATVLVVGAGPSGLVLALWLRRMGVRVRIIDKVDRPGTTSRAVAVQARTLELYRQVGLAGAVLQRGLEFAAVNLWVRGRHVGRAAFGDIGKGLSPFPFIVMFPQDQHEELLIERLAAEGVRVERGVELVGFEERAGGVLVRTRGPDGRESEGEAAYLVGCDGAHSAVRAALGIGFPGGTYERLFYVADVQMAGEVANQELHVALDDADFLGIFPLKGEGNARLIGTVRREAEALARPLTWDDVSQRAVERMKVRVDRVNWFSTYRVHHRVADRFRQGRAFLVGDAAHIHSPVGGQGMNTGIGDAINLAWKLAQVLRGQADTRLLDSYEPERIAFAQRLVATTDRAFTFVTRDGALARLVRLGVVPRIIPALTHRAAVRRFMFRAVSQTVINYRQSELSAGRAGSIWGGDRLPWVEPEGPGAGAGGEGAAAAGEREDNFTPLASLAWQVHVHGEATPEFAAAAGRLGLPLHTFAWTASAGRAGLARGAAYLVRPDGHVALADPAARADRLERYLDAQGLRLASGAAAR